MHTETKAKLLNGDLEFTDGKPWRQFYVWNCNTHRRD